MVAEKPPIDLLLEHYGATAVPHGRGWRKMRCPFHEDRHASASVNVELGRFRCFVCAVNEDAYGIVTWKGDASDFPSAKSFIENLLGRRYGDLPEGATAKQRRRRVFEESGVVRGQRSIFQTGGRRRPFAGT